jgi:hypothetical protein
MRESAISVFTDGLIGKPKAKVKIKAIRIKASPMAGISPNALCQDPCQNFSGNFAKT